MAELLESAQQQQRHEIADMQAVGGGIEAAIDRDRTFVEAATKRCLISGVLYQAACMEVVEDVRAVHNLKDTRPLR